MKNSKEFTTRISLTQLPNFFPFLCIFFSIPRSRKVLIIYMLLLFSPIICISFYDSTVFGESMSAIRGYGILSYMSCKSSGNFDNIQLLRRCIFFLCELEVLKNKIAVLVELYMAKLQLKRKRTFFSS